MQYILENIWAKNEHFDNLFGQQKYTFVRAS